MSTIKFTEGGLALAAFKMSIQNNAMLKMVLMNQEAIMDKLGITPNTKTILDKELIKRLEKTDIDYDTVSVMLELRNTLEELAKSEAWEFAVENDPDFDIDLAN